MERSSAFVVRTLAECLASFSGGAPASVLQNLVDAGTPERILEIITEGPESESVTDSASRVPGSADEALAEDAESQFSNNALMDGLKYVSDQVQSFENHMNDHDISGIRMKLDRLEVDIRKMKTTLKTTSATISVLEKYLSDSAATHRLEVSQMTSALAILHEAVLTMLKTMHTMSGAPSVEHRIVVEMAKSNRS